MSEAQRCHPSSTSRLHEIERPLAVGILGGLVTSTLLNLFIMPAPYSRWGEGIAR
ncbi:MAG: hypothetical protein ACRD3V_01270 [Vicinamibacteria bacterium]